MYVDFCWSIFNGWKISPAHTRIQKMNNILDHVCWLAIFATWSKNTRFLNEFCKKLKVKGRAVWNCRRDMPNNPKKRNPTEPSLCSLWANGSNIICFSVNRKSDLGTPSGLCCVEELGRIIVSIGCFSTSWFGGILVVAINLVKVAFKGVLCFR